MPKHVHRRTFERTFERTAVLAVVTLAATIALPIDMVFPKVIFICLLETLDTQAIKLVAIEVFIRRPLSL